MEDITLSRRRYSVALSLCQFGDLIIAVAGRHGWRSSRSLHRDGYAAQAAAAVSRDTPIDRGDSETLVSSVAVLFAGLMSDVPLVILARR